MHQIPYTYFIGWSKLHLFYYGSRYGKGCHPSDFWETYFTSSKRVAALRLEHGEPDIIQIRQEFDDVQSAMLWEKAVLRRMKVKRRKDFLNETMGNMPTMTGKTHSEETRALMSSKQKGVKKSPESVAKMRASLTGKKLSDQARKNISEGHKGIRHSAEANAKVAASKVGRKFYHKDGVCICVHEHPGEGWVPGKLTVKKYKTKKKQA